MSDSPSPTPDTSPSSAKSKTTDKTDQVQSTTDGNPVPYSGDHDRVAMLSLNADGSPAQHNPEIIGDGDAAVAATKRQFAEQAASAVDTATAAPVQGTTVGDDEAVQDPSIQAVKDEQDAAVAASESAAESVVGELSSS